MANVNVAQPASADAAPVSAPADTSYVVVDTTAHSSASGTAAADPTHGTVATTEAHGGAAEHDQPDPSALGFDATGWVALAMIVLLGIFIWKKVPAMITGGLDKKIADIKTQLDEAASLRAEAEKLRSEYAAKVKAAESEVAAMRAHAEEEAENILAKAKADTTDLIARRQKMAEDRIAAAERTALAEVREKAAKAATTAAASLIADKHDKATDKGLIDKTIATLDNA